MTHKTSLDNGAPKGEFLLFPIFVRSFDVVVSAGSRFDNSLR